MKKIEWMGASLETIREFPKEVKQEIGFALETAQIGGKAINVTPLVGFGGASVLEVISDGEGGTYRAVYTVRFAEVIYVLHAFQKKSKSGIATPKHEIDLVKKRLKIAREHYEQEYKKQNKEKRNVGTTG